MLKLNAIPMNLEYQLDIITSEVEDADEYLRNFTFNLINLPNVKVEIPYNDCKIVHNSIVTMNEEVEDNSDIPLRLVPGQFTRYTLTLNIDDAYMFSTPIKENLLISSVQLDVAEKDGKVDDSVKIV